MPRYRLTCWAALVLMMFSPAVRATAEDPVFRFGDYVRTIEGLEAPTAVAFDRSGRLLIAEADAAVVRGVDPGTGRTQAIFSGPLARPVAIAVCSQGRIYVSDLERDRIEVFAPDGPHLYGFGSRGDLPGEFMEPRGVVVHGDLVFVADSGNARVQAFNLAGEFQQFIGSKEGPALERPSGVAMLGETLVVTDTDAHRVLLFPLDGPAPQWFGEQGPFVGLLGEPCAVVAQPDHLLVLETSNHRVQSFHLSDGKPVRSEEVFGIHAILPREGEGRLHYPTGLAIGRLPDGTMIAAISEPLEDRVQLFRGRAPGAAATTDPWDPDMIPRQTHFGRRFAIDGPLLVVPETEAHVLRLFDLRGAVPVLIGEFGERGRSAGLYDQPVGINLNFDAREIIVGDEAVRRIDRLQFSFDPEAPRGFSARRIRLATSFAVTAPGLASGGAVAPAAMARFDDGTIVLLDARRRAIVLVGLDGETVIIKGADDRPFVRPVDVVVTADQRMLVVDPGARAVFILDRNGSKLGLISEDVQLRRPGGAAAAPDGRVYVSDSRRSQIVVFSAEGTFERAFGRPGTDPGELWQPAGVAIDERGRIFVMDYGNHRLQAFTADGEWQVAFGTGRAFLRRGGAP